MLLRFRNFLVYKEARKFRKKIYQLSMKFGKEELFVLTSQIRRAVLSICLNIAEGSNRTTDADFARYLNNALSSLEEVVACLDAALDEEYINLEKHRQYLQKAESLGS
jgi:four helix bundle protein